MGIDLDPLDDIFADEAVKNTKKVGKFQPKSKFRPPRKESAATSVSSSQAVQAVDSGQSELSRPVGTAKPSQHLISGSDVVPSDNGGWHASTEKSVGEHADIFIGLEALDDFLPPTTIDMECTVPPLEAVALNVSNSENGGAEHANPVLSSVEDSTHTCKVANAPAYAKRLADVDPLTDGEPIVSSSDGCDHMSETELRRELQEVDAMDSINMTKLTTKSGQRTGKFQPKPNMQMHKEICEASKSVSYSQSVPPEIGYAEQDSIPTYQQDDFLDLSSLGFTHTLPTEATSELSLNEESTNLMEMAQLHSGINLEGLPEIPAKLTSRRAKTGSNKTQSTSDPSSQQQKTCTSSKENETGRSLRPRKSKTNFCELVDEDEDEDEDDVLASGNFSEECPLSSAIEDENIINEEFQVENESQTKKKKQSEKTENGKEKPARKRKKTKEASNQDASTKHKKFSHSTRRRRVDKVLLETPEDDIDCRKVPLRDLILLAEHKERQTKKEEAAVGAPAATQSNGNPSRFYNQDETSNQGGEYNDGEGNPGDDEDTTLYFNYQTYMDRTPTKRWSKQETELFYEAVQQFGTDLSMIQQLFPGRTRRQVKLKYKKEDRQHPMRLREALTNRSKDHSHFQKVIEHLQQIAAEENQNADKDDLIDLEGNEVADERTSNADDGVEKDEHIEEKDREDVTNDFIEVESPLKPDDDEDYLSRWRQYKADT